MDGKYIKNFFLIINFIFAFILVYLIFKIFNNSVNRIIFVYYTIFIFFIFLINFVVYNFFFKKIFFLSYIYLVIFLFLYSLEVFLFYFIKDKNSKELFGLYNKLYDINKIEPTFYNIGGLSWNWFQENENNVEYMTLSGLRNTTTIFCKEGPDYSIYQSDEYGFNNNFMYGDYVKKKFKLLFIGDSFTHGACVNNEKNIPSVVNNHIIKNSGVKDNYVLNLGFSGYGPLTEYVVLREFINNIQFDSLVWLYFEGNDLDDLDLELSNKYLLKYLSDLSFKYDYFNSKDKVDRYLYSKHKEAVEYLKKDNIFNIINFLKLNKTRTFINKNILKVKLKKKKDKINDVSRYKELIKEFENILIQTKFILTKNNVNFNFVYIPSYISFLDTETKNIFIQNSDFNSILINNNHFRDEIINVVKNLEINYIDIYKEIIEANIDPLDYFPQKKINHFNESGYKFIGDLINKKFN